jgi:hypothetical protein
MKLRLVLIHSFLPLALGAILYLLFRSEHLKVIELFSVFGIENQLMIVRNQFIDLKSNIPSWIYYSAPDGLWSYSFIASYSFLWSERSNLWQYLAVFFCLSYEILQGLKILPGTFDFMDLAMIALGFILNKLILKPKLSL